MNIISIHIFPHEISEYKRIVDDLNVSLHKINTDQVQVWVCLNLNSSLIDYSGTTQYEKIKKQFTEINRRLNVVYRENIRDELSFMGVNEHRRETIKHTTDGDNILFLDCDLHFNKNLLRHLIETGQSLGEQNSFFILTPQCVRLWDTTWDCLVNNNFIKKPIGFFNEINPETLVERTYGNVYSKKINTFKWAGGWFTCISASLAKFIGIPQSFVGYGPDDTFMMECCKKLKLSGVEVSQYVLNGFVVCEDPRLKKTPNMFKKNIPNFRKESNKHFYIELNKFSEKL